VTPAELLVGDAVAVGVAGAVLVGVVAIVAVLVGIGVAVDVRVCVGAIVGVRRGDGVLVAAGRVAVGTGVGVTVAATIVAGDPPLPSPQAVTKTLASRARIQRLADNPCGFMAVLLRRFQQSSQPPTAAPVERVGHRSRTGNRSAR
jgi:hypothetical protein